MADWQQRATPVEESSATPDWQSRATSLEDDDAVVKDYLAKEDKYGGIGNQVVTGLEGAAAAGTFGLSTGVETALGVDPEGIRMRRETNPGSHMIGQVAGLAGTALIPGLGEANAAKVMTGAGNVAARAIGLGAAEGTLAKIGSAAVRAGVENAVFQSGDEVSKMLASDPYQSVETAVANIGISGLLGGGIGASFGAVSPLWKATAGGKVGQILEGIKSKAGGIDGTIDDAVHNATQTLGLDVGPEVKSRLSNDPWVQSAAKGLEQTDTTATGRGFQGKMQEFKTKLNDSIMGAFGKTPEDLPSIQELSKNQSGKSIGDALAKETSERLAPIGKQFDELDSKYGSVDLVPDTVQQVEVPDPNSLIGSGTKIEKTMIPGTASRISEKLEQAVLDNNWSSFEDPEVSSLLNGVRNELPKKKTISQLTDLISTVGQKANKNFANSELKRAGQVIKGILQSEKDELLISTLGKDAPELVDQFVATKDAWAKEAQVIGELKDRLGIKGSTSSFPMQLREMATTDAESIVNKLSGKNDAAALRLLQENFPETANVLRQYHLDDILKKAADKAKPGDAINPKALIGAIDNMSPEMREFAISPEALQKTQAVGTLLEQLEKAPHNHSNTARTMDKMFEYVPAAAVGMATMMAGGNPILAGVMGGLTKYLSKDAPDAVRLAVLKFMASGQPIEAGALKATVDVIEQTIKGENAVNSSVRRVFKSTREALPTKTDKISERDREKLDKRVVAMTANPEGLLDIGKDSSYYLPEHSSVMTETAGRVIGYLSSIRPSTEPKSPLDPKVTLSATQKATYNRALDLADNPLLILNNVKQGTLTSKDLVSVRTMYPALYNKLAQKFMSEIVDRKTDDESIPYPMRMSLSLFLAQPLDSTMLPQSIMANQPMNQAPPAQTGAKQGSVQKLDKIDTMAATPTQIKEMKNLKG